MNFVEKVLLQCAEALECWRELLRKNTRRLSDFPQYFSRMDSHSDVFHPAVISTQHILHFDVIMIVTARCLNRTFIIDRTY